MNHPSHQMFLTFKEDLKKNISFFKALSENLKDKQLTTSDQETAQKVFHEIHGITKLLQTNEIEKLSGKLKEIFHLKQLENSARLNDLFEIIAKAVDLFIELSEIPEKQLFLFEKTHAEFINDFIKKINVLSFEKTAERPSSTIYEQKNIGEDSFSDSHMIDLFKIELETQAKILNEQLILYEQSRNNSHFESLMRAAHSIKGAAKVLNLSTLVQLSHLLEDCFVNAKLQKLSLKQSDFDVLFEAVDFFMQLSKIPNKEMFNWMEEKGSTIGYLVDKINQIILEVSTNKTNPVSVSAEFNADHAKGRSEIERIESPVEKDYERETDRVLRVSSQSLNRLMGLAGESMVESRWLNPFSDALFNLKKKQTELTILFENFRDFLKTYQLSEIINHNLNEIQEKLQHCRQNLSDRLSELEMFISRHSSLTDRLYNEVIESRMRPFADGVEAFPRLARDLAKELNKKVRLEILGRKTPVDRDILEKLEIPLSHLLRNAIDHGIEPPPMRVLAGKSMEGQITIEARHLAGMLSITFSDDGRGLDFEKIRKTIAEKRMIKEEIADKLTENELLEFLFLPGFTTSPEVTEISGRGIGLNIVHNLVQSLTGSIRIINRPGIGLTISLQLPLTLSVIRALIADISGEPYAFPLARLDQAIEVPESSIKTIENRQYFNFLGNNIGIIPATQILKLKHETTKSNVYSVIILNDHSHLYGIVVDKFLGEKEMVVHELDPRLGKIPNINSGSLLDDGSPVLIMDVDDILQSVDQLLREGAVPKLTPMEQVGKAAKKHILVVDDSLTVREVECRLLRNQGYEVDSAVNGVEAWNAIRIGKYDLVITDVDMPRMNGIELVKNIKSDDRFKNIPIMIVSYKEREGDRIQGLEAGANYYLTKSSFHDETLINAVIDLIGRS